jgi:hypothetical protein
MTRRVEYRGYHYGYGPGLSVDGRLRCPPKAGASPRFLCIRPTLRVGARRYKRGESFEELKRGEQDLGAPLWCRLRKSVQQPRVRCVQRRGPVGRMEPLQSDRRPDAMASIIGSVMLGCLATRPTRRTRGPGGSAPHGVGRLGDTFRKRLRRGLPWRRPGDPGRRPRCCRAASFRMTS